MLFQMCYGPEIQTIFESILRQPGKTVGDLKHEFQYKQDGDIKSLIEGVITFLEEVKYVNRTEEGIIPLEKEWDRLRLFRNMREISRHEPIDSLNYVFTTLYDQLFVKPDRMFLTNMHHHINSKFERTLVGHEKINAWKRMMECFGLGRRAYTGFYALPQISLLKELVQHISSWEGPLHQYCETHIEPTLPCLTTEGNVYSGLIFGLAYLNSIGYIELSQKQDLPFKSYGPNHEWNWIHIKGVV